MARRRSRKAAFRRRRLSWRSVLSILVMLGLGYVASREDEKAESGQGPAAIFAVFARLDVDPGAVARMRPSPLPPASKPADIPWQTVREVIDGDSLKLANGDMVRLIGIDAPEASANHKLHADIGRMGIRVSERELVRLGREAAAHARRLAQGKRCWIEYDRSESDQYDRTLGYVHLEDGSVLNERMIADGYAKVYMNQAFVYKQRYILLQTEARANKRGLWNGEKEIP